MASVKSRVLDSLMHWNYRRRQLVCQSDLREILETKPIVSRDDATTDVFMLTAGEDLLPLLIAAKTMQFWTEIPLKFNVCCDDGLLTGSHEEIIAEHIENVRLIVDRSEIIDRLRDYPTIKKFHTDSSDPSYPKLSIPALYAERPKVILMDTDVIFYRFPDRLVSWAIHPQDDHDLYRNPVNVNNPYPYPALEKEMRDRFKIAERPMLESGLLAFHKSVLELELLEQVSEAFSRHGFLQWSKELEIYNVLFRIRGKMEALPRKDYGGIWTYGAAAIHYFSKDMYRESSISHIVSMIKFLKRSGEEGFTASSGLDR
jgi:hypothetical protein